MSQPGPSFYRDLYGPRTDPGGRYPMSGDDVLAVRRVLSRAGWMDWNSALDSNVYGQLAEDACRAFQRSVGITGPDGGDPRGHYGKQTHDALRAARRAGHSGEPAWDAYSTELYAGAIVEPPPKVPPFLRDLWGPAYDPHDRYPMSGKDVAAVRRVLSRAGYLDWEAAVSSNVYGTAAEDSCRAFQLDAGISGSDGPPRGHYGKSTHAALAEAKAAGKHEWAWDARSIELYGQAESSGGDPRGTALDHLEKRLGYTEQPDGSNSDSRSDGIRTAQLHTAGGGDWLVGEPWCGCWCFYALESAGVKKIDSHLASVAAIEDYARSASKCYRGWTTDRSKVKAGDLAIIGGYGVHVETVRGFSGSSTLTYGGNTSPGSGGSQSNGGGAYARTRSASEVRGYALVRYPGE